MIYSEIFGKKNCDEIERVRKQFFMKYGCPIQLSKESLFAYLLEYHESGIWKYECRIDKEEFYIDVIELSSDESLETESELYSENDKEFSIKAIKIHLDESLETESELYNENYFGYIHFFYKQNETSSKISERKKEIGDENIRPKMSTATQIKFLQHLITNGVAMDY